MAFRFNWPEFDQEFYVEAKTQLEAALNKGNKPSAIVDHITVKELDMGTKVNPFFTFNSFFVQLLTIFSH
jgi:hypothetical protein